MLTQWQTWPELFGVAPSAAVKSYVISYVMYVVSALMFALLAAVLVHLFAPYACGSGISEVSCIHYLSLGKASVIYSATSCICPLNSTARHRRLAFGLGRSSSPNTWTGLQPYSLLF